MEIVRCPKCNKRSSRHGIINGKQRYLCQNATCVFQFTSVGECKKHRIYTLNNVLNAIRYRKNDVIRKISEKTEIGFETVRQWLNDPLKHILKYTSGVNTKPQNITISSTDNIGQDVGTVLNDNNTAGILILKNDNNEVIMLRINMKRHRNG